jgi:FlaA1/EpsC-like NDP-sugar epimerase
MKLLAEGRRRALVAVLHLVFTVAASYLALWLRFDGAIPASLVDLYVRILPWLLAIRAATFFQLRLHRSLWRYTSVRDLRDIVAAVAIGSVAAYAVVRWGLGIAEYPRSAYVMDAILLIFLIGGSRLLKRAAGEAKPGIKPARVLIFGAGDAGEMIVRDMKRHRGYRPIGFIDDDRSKRGQQIHGVPVLGDRDALAAIVAGRAVDEVLVAIPNADPPLIRSVVKSLQPFKVRMTTLPNWRDILGGRVTVGHIRQLAIEDLLPRAPVGLRSEKVQELIADRRILVTGAGGSIGAELCRQISCLKPAELVLFERYENNLYSIANDLADRDGLSAVRLVIGDVTDAQRLEAVFAEFRPEIVFHAAAHKHVPLMELNVCEAVKNNVIGTRMVAEAAVQHGVERFILISSDKAVNPSSVMGATKRVAELLVQSMASASETCLMTVRFGNVLGSNGSVVPRFLAQIKSGGPVTVTHPEIRRYFMLISEAVELVLHAATLSCGGGVYVLDMGEQIRLLDLARHLIRLAGYVPDVEIPIAFCGLRPGEKLWEELASAEERLEPSPVDKIMRVQADLPHFDPAVVRAIAQLERLASVGDTLGVIAQLGRIVTTFRSTPAGTAPVGTAPLAANQALSSAFAAAGVSRP